MPVSEDGVLLIVLTAVDGKSLTRFPAPHCAFAAVQVGRDLLPRFQSFLWGVPRRHPKTPAEDYTRGHANHAGFNLGSGTILVDPVEEELGSDGELVPGVAEE